MNFISLGGWCGTKFALKYTNYSDEASLPFDYVRTSIEGIIDCVENDFKNYLPKKIEVDDKITSYKCFSGEYVSFYHHDITNRDVIDSIIRKTHRFYNKMGLKNKTIFVRTICTNNYYDEIKHSYKLQYEIDNKWPQLDYILVFIIPEQNITSYYKNIGNKIFIFSLNYSIDDQNDNKLKSEYGKIFDFIINQNLFYNIPEKINLDIKDTNNKLWLVDGYPMVDHVEKYY
jgi:hypothetical protein